MRLTILFTLLLWFSQRLLAQSSDSLIHYSVENGLTGNFIFRAYQDSKGFMWFATDRGLTRFDGTHFKSYSKTEENTKVFEGFAIGEDSHKRLWIYTSSAYFCYFDIQKNSCVTIPNRSSAPMVSYFTYIYEEAPDKLIFYTSNNIIYELDKNLNLISWKKNTEKSTLTPKNYPKVNKDISIFEYLKDSIYTHKKGSNLPEYIKHYPSSYAISRVYTDSAFFYVQGQQLGVYSHGRTLVKAIQSLSNNKDALNIQIFDIGSPKRVLVKTGKEFFVVDENLKRLTEFDFINKFSLNTIYFDKKDNLWICTIDDGIYLKIREKKQSVAPLYLKNLNVDQLVCDRFGNLFVGNSLGELFIFKDSISRKLDIQNIPKSAVTQLFIDSKNNLFVSWRNVGYTIFPMTMLYDKKAIVMKNAHDLKPENSTKPYYKHVHIPFKLNEVGLVLSGNIRCFSKNMEDELIISVNQELRILKDSLTHWVSHFLVNVPHITSIASAGKHDLWVTSNGLIRLKGQKIDSLLAQKKLNPYLNNAFFDLKKDQNGNLWTTPNDIGLCYIDTSNFKINTIKEVSENYVLQIFLDAKNRIWAATNGGVVMVEILNTSPFKYRFKRIDKSMGLPSNEIARIAVNDSILFVSTNKGLSAIPLSKILSETKPPKSTTQLHFSNLKINQKDTILRGSYDLRYNENNLEIDFAGLSYDPQNPIRYEYRMQKEGETEVDWRTTKEPHLVFSFLPAGKYTLHVRAFDVENHILEMEEPLVFNVRLPFWKTGWFLGSVFAFLGIGTWFLYQNNIKRIQKEEAEKAEISKRFTVLELQALQAQMNPHFVFNALTAIQNFIWNKDVKSANDYLTDFSSLMRLFLESSRRKFLTVEEEMTLLKLYVHLEQLRFPETFTTKFEVGENINTTDELPSMLIQPFVENAINHGLLYKQEKGLLQVSFSKENNVLTCIVEDDGVGREAATLKRQASMKAHKSRATEILQERIALMKSVDGMEVLIDIQDKKEGDNNSFGTKVTITITEV
jgi:ligand-binding sensor domain-containing protein